MIIEKCEQNQAEEIREIINKMWPSKTIEEISHSLQNKKEIIFIAKVGGKIISFVHGIIRDDYIEGVSEYPALYVEGIFVEENYRHQRVASSLIEKLVEFGKERNIKVFCGFSTLKPLYTGHFSPVYPRQTFYAIGRRCLRDITANGSTMTYTVTR